MLHFAVNAAQAFLLYAHACPHAVGVEQVANGFLEFHEVFGRFCSKCSLYLICNARFKRKKTAVFKFATDAGHAQQVR